MLRLESFQGQEVEPYLDALGALRITVFRDYPYLYDGNLDYERDYLRRYLHCQQSLVVLAFFGDAVVGATTCTPMADEDAEFKEPFIGAGYDLDDICYFGESVLLPAYRGRGLGKLFFIHREAHARGLGLPTAAFCAVNRPSTHPLQPAGYRPLDGFWKSMGYTQQPELQARFRWKDVDQPEETEKTLTFWTKNLA